MALAWAKIQEKARNYIKRMALHGAIKICPLILKDILWQKIARNEKSIT